jgi:hypothetical protein
MLIGHELRGELSPELIELDDQKIVLNELMFQTSENVKEVERRKSNLFIRAARLLICGPSDVRSDIIYYTDPDSELYDSSAGDHAVGVWIESGKRLVNYQSIDAVSLYTKVTHYDNGQEIQQPRLQFTAIKGGEIEFGEQDRFDKMKPEVQLEIVEDAIETVKHLSGTYYFLYQPLPVNI